VFWGDGGLTILSNLVLLCRRHHRAIHHRGATIEMIGDGEFVFRLADGTELVSQAPCPPVDGGASALVDANGQLGLGIDAETPVARWAGERMDLADAVTGVLCEVKGVDWVNRRYDPVSAA
jgi:hypothetical protein